MSQRIQLSQGKWAIVDDDDYERLCQWRWSASEKRKGMGEFYAVRVDRDTKRMIPMHRQIMGSPEGMVVDHINGDPLDNRRCNLRVCTQAQNVMNRRPNRQKTLSKYKGVYWHKGASKWMAMIGRDQKYLGLHRCETAAALAYDRAAMSRYGDYAYLNLGGQNV